MIKKKLDWALKTQKKAKVIVRLHGITLDIAKKLYEYCKDKQDHEFYYPQFQRQWSTVMYLGINNSRKTNSRKMPFVNKLISWQATLNLRILKWITYLDIRFTT